MPREDENSTDANAPKISSHPDRSLGDGVTGDDFAKAAKNVDRSLGDQSTSGDASSSVSDLSGSFDGADDGMELVDLSSRYEIKGTLGRGGMGDVVLAYDKRIKRQVAIKRILGELAASRRAFQRFLTEAQSVGALNHPNIVQVIDFGRDREGPFLILEYVEGGTLLQKLEAGPLPVAEAVRLCCQILDGLAVAHSQGIIHRDIKPANILLTSRGDAKLTDFGLARQEQADTGLTSTGAILGTFDYMPPEQRKDAAMTDSRSDLWSLAATLYQMLTGEPPRVIDLDALPPQLRPILSIALKPKKEDRYQTATKFHEALLAADRPQVIDTGKLREGECVKCHAVNATDRKFCKECGASLVEPCLSCQSPVPAWEKFCGSCGKNVADAVAAIRETLKEESEQIRVLSQKYRYDEALALLEKMAAIQDHRFDDFTQWAKSSLQPVKDDSVRKREEVSSLFTAAKAAADQCQYKDAAKFLSQIPEPMLNDQSKQLQALVVTRSERLKVLSEEIKTAVKAKQFDGLLPKVEEYLSLKPTDGNAHKLAERLRSKALMQAALVVDEPRSFPLELPPSKQPGKKTTIEVQLFAITTACCVVVAVVAIYVLSRPNEGIRSIEVLSRPKEETRSIEVVSQALPYNTTIRKNSIGMEFKLLPAGKFKMGSNSGDADENPVHEVGLTKSFEIGVYEVTQEQYERVMGKNPSKFKYPQNPVENVSWDDSVEFCRKLSELLPEKSAGYVYRLPTEAEWEYACRAGTETEYSFGNNKSHPGNFTWNNNDNQPTRHVGQKKPNPWGLYDMHGNVFEWCQDWYDKYPTNSVNDPTGPSSGSLRVYRGGGWYYTAVRCRSANRYYDSSDYRNDDLGFRVAAVPK